MRDARNQGRSWQEIAEVLALLDREGTRASFAFASLGIRDRRTSVEHALADDVRRRAPVSPSGNRLTARQPPRDECLPLWAGSREKLPRGPARTFRRWPAARPRGRGPCPARGGEWDGRSP
ncbi:hypothetical protein [Streptomyces sp. NPDC050804]|uniref:hypothetical protein n=1 Tax=Streptomyces sp. NPDC050804 TaxID=3154745 RepID=UPI003412D669